MSDNPSSSNNYFDYLSKNEEGNYFLDGILDVKKIKEQTNFTLSETQNFITKSFLSKLFDRKNIIKYGKMIGETAVPIEQTKGDFLIQIINRKQIRKKLSKLQQEERNKIAYIHISTIQIILKSTMKTGISAPIELEIRDDRLINREESIIAKGKGNLGVEIIKFDINLQQGISLTDGNLDSSIIIKYELKRKNFMKESSKPFSVTYQINYALTNSHHSLAFKDKEAITIEDLFKPLIQLESPLKIIKSNYDHPRISIDERSSSMRLTDKQKEMEKEENKEIKNITILHQNDNTSEIKKLQELIVEMSKKL
ncbi:unnamed protein product [Linum tenue]|uniref:Movement protein n=1 Tax=Linum tenue TaxID=586396 RepID=A0AAV0IPJ9_9ROSI|nr:unnamed protein product [Linum tenue]